MLDGFFLFANSVPLCLALEHVRLLAPESVRSVFFADFPADAVDGSVWILIFVDFLPGFSLEFVCIALWHVSVLLRRFIVRVSVRSEVLV